MCGETRHCSSPVTYSPNREAWWWQHHAVGVFFSCRDRTTGCNRGKDECGPSTGISWTKTFSRVLRTSDWAEGLPSNKTNDPKHTAKITKECFHNNSVTVLEWPSQSPDLNPIEISGGPKMAVHQRLPSNLTELEGSARRNDRGSPNPGVKTCASFPKRLIAVLIKRVLILHMRQRV